MEMSTGTTGVQSCDDMTIVSTSASVTNPIREIRPPGSIWQIGTTMLASGALLVLLALPMAESTGPNRAQDNRAVTRHASTPTPVRTSAMVESITMAFGLNRSQAADVLRVRRQTIYNWLNGAEAEGGNLARIQAIYDLVGAIPAFVDPVMAIRKTPDGSSSLLEMLSAERPDKGAILSWVETLGKPVRHRRAPLLSDILREAGISRDEEAERQHRLDGISHHQG
jgi:hypothetical protein